MDLDARASSHSLYWSTQEYCPVLLVFGPLVLVEDRMVVGVDGQHGETEDYLTHGLAVDRPAILMGLSFLRKMRVATALTLRQSRS